jgi:hypothetical protein
MFKKLNQLIEAKLIKALKEIELLDKEMKNIDTEHQWHILTGKKFNELICNYPISEEELLSISETVCKFVAITRCTNIDKYLFKDSNLEEPRLPYML